MLMDVKRVVTDIVFIILTMNLLEVKKEFFFVPVFLNPREG